MSTGLLKIIKEAALNAVDNAKMCDVRYGIVNTTSPLEIKVTPQFVIPEQMLVTPHHLTNYNTTVNIDGELKTITVYNELKTGDEVALLRLQGGQQYIILDKV